MDNGTRDAAAINFAQPEHKLQTRWPVLDLVHERFCKLLAAEMTRKLQFVVTIENQPSHRVAHNTYIGDLPDSTLVHEFAMEPLTDLAWFTLDFAALFAMVDSYFGGTGQIADDMPMRELTATERRVTNHVMVCVTEALGEAWKMVQNLGIRHNASIKVDRLKKFDKSGIVVSCPMTLKLPGGESTACLSYPYAMLEPLAGKLGRDERRPERKDTVFSRELQAGLMDCSLDVRGVLAESEISLRELLALKPGDFIPLKTVENVEFKTENMPLFDARVGISNGRVSASVSNWRLNNSSKEPS